MPFAGRATVVNMHALGYKVPAILAPVAQLDRATGFEPVGRAFESLQVRFTCQYAESDLTRVERGGVLEDKLQADFCLVHAFNDDFRKHLPIGRHE